MAIMYPEFFPREPNPDDPEFEVFQSLRLLPDHFFVFYSKRFKGGRKSNEECEVDFIVFDRKKNLLCVEVKGGSITYDGEQDEWMQNGVALRVSPDRQATAGTHAVIEFLGEAVKDVNVGWCVCFPNCSLPDRLSPPSNLPKAIIIDENGLLEPLKAIELVNRYHEARFGRHGCNSRVAKELLGRLTRGVGFIQKLGVRVAKDRKQLVQVTDEQFGVLEDLMLNPRVVVNGYAGSGKTLLAQEFAKRLATLDKSVLLLFFNRMVANVVRYGIDKEMSIDCETFHGFARRRIAEMDTAWWENQDKKAEDLWDFVVPLKLAELSVSDATRYDAIIVDEGQDFKREWFEVLEDYLRDQQIGHLCVFFDEFQDIFGHWTDLPWSSRVTKKVLTRNCRNTKAIIDHLRGINECKMQPFPASPSGRPVVVRKPRDVAEAKALLVSDLKMLLEEGIFPGQIVILIDQHKAESILADLKSVGRVRIEVADRSYRERSRTIRYSRINLFKGLEADVVFAIQTLNDANRAYTECSRGRSMLFHYHLQ